MDPAPFYRAPYTREMRDYASRFAHAAHFEGGKYDTTGEILSAFPCLSHDQAHALWNYSMFEAMW